MKARTHAWIVLILALAWIVILVTYFSLFPHDIVGIANAISGNALRVSIVPDSTDTPTKVEHFRDYTFFTRGDSVYRVYPYHWEWPSGRRSRTFADTVAVWSVRNGK